MYDLKYKCLNCGEIWIGLKDETEDGTDLDIEIIKNRDPIDCKFPV